MDDFLTVVNSSPGIAITLPIPTAEWNDCNLGFQAKATDNVMMGTVLAINVFFKRTMMSSLNEVDNQVTYYSGHYESYGVNCQAAMQADMQFSYFGIHGPGNTNDLITYPRAEPLKTAINNLPFGMYSLMDVTYPLSERHSFPSQEGNVTTSTRNLLTSIFPSSVSILRWRSAVLSTNGEFFMVALRN